MQWVPEDSRDGLLPRIQGWSSMLEPNSSFPYLRIQWVSLFLFGLGFAEEKGSNGEKWEEDAWGFTHEWALGLAVLLCSYDLGFTPEVGGRCRSRYDEICVSRMRFRCTYAADCTRRSDAPDCNRRSRSYIYLNLINISENILYVLSLIVVLVTVIIISVNENTFCNNHNLLSQNLKFSW